MKKNKLRIGRVILALLILVAIVFSVVKGAPMVLGLLSGSQKKEVVTSEPVEEPNYIATVVLDAGHGEADPGAIYGEYKEKDLNLTYVQKLGAYLQKNNVNVIYTRDSDKVTVEYKSWNNDVSFADMRKRAELGEEYNADYFISIHMNSCEKENSASGLQIYTVPKYKDSTDLAKNIGTSLKELSYIKYQGEFDGSKLRVLRLSTTMPILIEVGYLNNSTDRAYMVDDAKQNEVVEKIGEGLIKKINAGKIEPDLKLEKQPDL